MKVKDLIKALSKLDGELVVYGCSDHGQTPEIIKEPCVFFTESAAYTLWGLIYIRYQGSV